MRAKAPVHFNWHITSRRIACGRVCLEFQITCSAPGVDGQNVRKRRRASRDGLKVLQSVHRQGYRAPDIRRVYIPKPGKQEKRPIRVCRLFPTGPSSAVQPRCCRPSTSKTFFRARSAGGPGGAHHALATLVEVIAGSKTGWVLEADLKNFFGRPRLGTPVRATPASGTRA